MAEEIGQGFRALAGLVELVAPFAVRRLMATCRITIVNPEVERETLSSRPVIGALWHQTVIGAAARFDRRPFVIMVSRSRDGEIGAAILRGFGMKTVRGSSSRGGREALQEIIERGREGRTLGLILDGPRGPARVAKIGAVVAAKETGLPIVPVAMHLPDAWHLRSWDRTAIPKPFSRIWYQYGEPVAVAKGASNEECERIRGELQATLVRLEAELAERARRAR
jgi:hypothetical protein